MYNPVSSQALIRDSEIIGKIHVVVNLIPTTSTGFMLAEGYRQKPSLEGGR